MADVDGDGSLDAIVVNSYFNSLMILKGDGKGGFAAPVTLVTGGNLKINAVLPLDVDNDGHVDLVVADNTNSVLAILRNKGNGDFETPSRTAMNPSSASELYAADLNGDGVIDLLATSQANNSPQVAVFMGGLKASFKARDVKPYGAAGVLQTGSATYGGDAGHASAISTPVTFYSNGDSATPQILWAPESTTWSVNLPLKGVLNASTVGNVAGAFAYTATLAGGSATPVTASSMLNVKGNYTLSVVFTPSDAVSYTTATATIPLTISDPDFAVSAPTPGPAGLILPSGGTVSTSIAIESRNGFNGYVSLSCSTAAVGVACAFNPSSVATGSTATMTLSAPAASVSTNLRAASKYRGSYFYGMTFASLLLCFASFTARRRKLLLCLILGMIISMFYGCGGSGSPKATTLALSTSSSKVASNSALTLTAQLSENGKNAPNGTVDFYDSAALIGSATVSNGVATFSTSSMAVGAHTLTAKFAGEGKLLASASNAVTQVVTGKTNVTVTASYGSVSHATTLDVTLQ